MVFVSVAWLFRRGKQKNPTAGPIREVPEDYKQEDETVRVPARTLEV